MRLILLPKMGSFADCWPGRIIVAHRQVHREPHGANLINTNEDPENEEIPIILLPGMAADVRVFEAQLAIFPNLKVQPWIEPLPRESLPAYAARLALLVDPGRPCIVGGTSFGGIVALEMAGHLPALACILIGSVRSPSELPRNIRWLRLIAWLGPSGLRMLASIGSRISRWFKANRVSRRLQRLSRPESAFERWAMCALCGWKLSRSSDQVRIYQIHGSADRVLPVSLTHPDVIVPGGEHALSSFNPSPVNQFIAHVLKSAQLPGN